MLCILYCVFVSRRPVSCVPNVDSGSGLGIYDCPFGFLRFIYDEYHATNEASM